VQQVKRAQLELPDLWAHSAELDQPVQPELRVPRVKPAFPDLRVRQAQQAPLALPAKWAHPEPRVPWAKLEALEPRAQRVPQLLLVHPDLQVRQGSRVRAAQFPV